MTDDIQQHRKEAFWEQARQSVERLKADPAAWKSYQDEIALWDGLAGDEAPYYTPEEEAQIESEFSRTYGDRPPGPGNRSAKEGVRGLP